MNILVDQCGKIADTATATVIAFSNGRSFTVLIPAQVKRDCLHILRKRGKKGQSVYYRLFAIGLFLLLKDYFGQLDLVTIDEEYTGHEAQIKEQLIYLLRSEGLSVDPHQIRFKLIHQKGQKNPAAHDRAYYTHRGKEKAGKIITAEELLRHIK